MSNLTKQIKVYHRTNKLMPFLYAGSMSLADDDYGYLVNAQKLSNFENGEILVTFENMAQIYEI